MVSVVAHHFSRSLAMGNIINHGCLLLNRREKKVFARRFANLPANHTTDYRALTFTKNLGYNLKKNAEYIVTIHPPMQVATQYLNSFISGTSGEGKTFNAANLAVSFALLGKKVILCGLDIRKPALGKLFGLNDHFEGITPLLTLDKVGLGSLKAHIKNSGINDNLDILLAGPVPPNPTELLARENFGQIIDMLRSLYDYVIFDTAPVGLVTDTLQIGQQADITVYVCRADYTPKSTFGLLNSLAKEKKMPNPCIVLNGVDMSKRKYGYYYGYGRYGKYGRYGRYGYGKYGYGNYGNYGQYAESHYGNKDDDSIKK